MNSQPGESVTSTVTERDWVRRAHPGYLVELAVYGDRMKGRLHTISATAATVRIPAVEQSAEVRQFSVTGHAVFSLDNAAARVPVSAQSAGDEVRLQFVGPAEILQRRRYVRVPLQLPVRLRWRNRPGEPWQRVASWTEDVSLGGVRVASATAVWPSKGQRVTLTLELSQGEIEETATVVGFTPAYGLRLSFVGLSPLSQHWLRRLLEADEDPE